MNIARPNTRGAIFGLALLNTANYRVLNMWKSWSVIVGGVSLVALWVVCGLVQAGPISDTYASRVIELTSLDPAEKAPVVSSVTLDPKGRFLITAGDDHLVRIWNAQSGQLLYRLPGHVDWVRAANFRTDGQAVATAGADRQIVLCDIKAGRMVTSSG
jgi:WD40 repeat protein